MVFKVFQELLLPYTIINFLKLLANFENAYWKILLQIPFAVIGRRSLISLAEAKMRKN